MQVVGMIEFKGRYNTGTSLVRASVLWGAAIGTVLAVVRVKLGLIRGKIGQRHMLKRGGGGSL